MKNPALQPPASKKAKITHNGLAFLVEITGVFRTLHIFI
jgi:hypothetical protein